MFRPLRFVPHLIVVLALALALVFALASRFPEAPVLAEAAGWPVVGPGVERFRRSYLPPPPSAAPPPESGVESFPSASREVEVVRVIDPDMVGSKPKVWAPPGTPILAEPSPGSRELARVEHLFPLSRLERRGDWFRVRYGTRRSGLHKGWVHLPGYREPTAEELNAPAPVLPLAPVPVAPESLAAARLHLGGDAAGGVCGPFGLLTDSRSDRVREMCGRVGAGIEAAHRRRFGLELVGRAAETIFLFDREDAYRAFRAEVADELTSDAFASPAKGFVAVELGARSLEVVEASLIHELTHLLNRRALGPALPPWLDEGMARHLESIGLGDRAARASVGGRAASLEVLFDLDQPAFRRRARENYRSSGRWIGYLVDGPDPALGDGVRGFLRAVSRGEPITAELLLDHLGRDWSELEGGFRRWEGQEPLAAAD